MEPCTSSNGSPPPNSCFALHLNQTGALHEPLSTSSAFARASARTQIPCLIRPKLLRHRSLQPPHHALGDASPLHSDIQAADPTQHSLLPDPSQPAQPHSKYIAFHGGGFLQVAVSEAPLQSHATANSCAAGAPDTALRLLSTYPRFDECLGDYARRENPSGYVGVLRTDPADGGREPRPLKIRNPRAAAPVLRGNVGSVRSCMFQESSRIPCANPQKIKGQISQSDLPKVWVRKQRNTVRPAGLSSVAKVYLRRLGGLSQSDECFSDGKSRHAGCASEPPPCGRAPE